MLRCYGRPEFDSDTHLFASGEIIGFVAIVESGRKELRRRPGDQAARL